MTLTRLKQIAATAEPFTQAQVNEIMSHTVGPYILTRPELLAAVLGDADLLWAARNHMVCVLSPWERTAKSSLRHTGSEPAPFCPECGGGDVHEVKIERARTKVELWRVVDILPVVRHRAVAHGRPLRREPFIFEAPTREACEEWCDTRLREADVLLANGVIE